MYTAFKERKVREEQGLNLLTDPKQIAVLIRSKDRRERFLAVKSTRTLLSNADNLPIEEILQCDLLPILVQCLQEKNHKIQYEAAWAITNIASGSSEQTRAVVQAGAVPHFIRHLSSPDRKLCEQALWALANIIGDGPGLRDYVLSQNVVEPLLNVIRTRLDSAPPATTNIPSNSSVASDSSMGMLRNVCWTLANLCRHKDPALEMSVVEQIVPVFKTLLKYNDVPALIDAAWALSYIGNGENDQIQLLVDADLVKPLVDLLSHEEQKVRVAALRAAGNILTGNDEQTQKVLDCGILKHIHELLDKDSRQASRKDLIWCLSNITAGTTSQIQAVIAHDLLPVIIDNLAWRGNTSIQKEAIWALCNLTENATNEQIAITIKSGSILPLCEALSFGGDSDMIRVVLDGLENILNKASDEILNEAYDDMKMCGGVERIRRLQNHQNERVRKKATTIFTQHFVKNRVTNGDPLLES